MRGKDVFIIQSGGGKVNHHLIGLLITISAYHAASAKRITAMLPLFPYSRQSDIPYNKTDAPLAKVPAQSGQPGGYTFDSILIIKLFLLIRLLLYYFSLYIVPLGPVFTTYRVSILPRTHCRCRYADLPWNCGCICPLRYVSAHIKPRS